MLSYLLKNVVYDIHRIKRRGRISRISGRDAILPLVSVRLLENDAL